MFSIIVLLIIIIGGIYVVYDIHKANEIQFVGGSLTCKLVQDRIDSIIQKTRKFIYYVDEVYPTGHGKYFYKLNNFSAEKTRFAKNFTIKYKNIEVLNFRISDGDGSVNFEIRQYLNDDRFYEMLIEFIDFMIDENENRYKELENRERKIAQKKKLKREKQLKRMMRG